MNIARLIIPLDELSESLFRESLHYADRQSSAKGSTLAHLINQRTIESATSQDLAALHSGKFKQRPLSNFRRLIQRMSHSQKWDDPLTLIDPLFALTAQAWLCSANIHQVIIAHSGRDQVAGYIAKRAQVYESCAPVLADEVLREVLSLIPLGVDTVLANVSPGSIGKMFSLSVDKLEKASVPSWNGTLHLTEHIQEKKPDSSLGWFSRRCHIPDVNKDSKYIAKLNLEVRALELKVLEARQHSQDATKLLAKKIEEHEHQVRPVGRRLRYGLQMIRSGKIKKTT